MKQYPDVMRKAKVIRGLWTHMEFNAPNIVDYSITIRASVWRLLKKMHRNNEVIFPSI